MTLVHVILAVLALYIVQIFLQETSAWRFDLRRIIGTRDVPPELTVTAARLGRAKDNLREALPLFLGLALLALVVLGETPAVTSGALLFLVARILYVPAYVSGIPGLRSALWLLANLGLLLMAWPLL